MCVFNSLNYANVGMSLFFLVVDVSSNLGAIFSVHYAVRVTKHWSVQNTKLMQPCHGLSQTTGYPIPST